MILASFLEALAARIEVIAAGDLKSRLMFCFKRIFDKNEKKGIKYGQNDDQRARHQSLAVNALLRALGVDIENVINTAYLGKELTNSSKEERLAYIDDNIEDSSHYAWAAYLPWAFDQIAANVWEDYRRVGINLKTFAESVKKKSEGLPSKDINYYKTVQQFIEAVESISSAKKKLLKKDSDIEVWETFTQQALASFTPRIANEYVWCVARSDQDHYQNYMDRGGNPRFIVIIDAEDPERRLLAFVTKNEVFEIKEERDYTPDTDDPLLEKAIEFFESAGIGHSTIGRLNSIDAYELVSHVLRRRYRERELINTSIFDEDFSINKQPRFTRMIEVIKAVGGEIAFLKAGTYSTLLSYIEALGYIEEDYENIEGDVHTALTGIIDEGGFEMDFDKIQNIWSKAYEGESVSIYARREDDLHWYINLNMAILKSVDRERAGEEPDVNNLYDHTFVIHQMWR